MKNPADIPIDAESQALWDVSRAPNGDVELEFVELGVRISVTMSPERAKRFAAAVVRAAQSKPPRAKRPICPRCRRVNVVRDPAGGFWCTDCADHVSGALP